MLAGLEQSTTRYPLERALSDLNDYYFAGTFIGALQAIQKDAGVKETRAQDRIDDITGLGERVMEGREQALRIIEADVDLARRRLVEWYRSLPPGSPDRVAARVGILAVVDPVPGAILTDGQPDPEKWLGADPGVPAEHRATADQLAAWVAGLMNPVRSDAERFKGELIPILLGKG
jgi:hypothetical protein